MPKFLKANQIPYDFLNHVDGRRFLIPKNEYDYFCVLIEKLKCNIDDINYVLKQDFAMRANIIYFLVLSIWINETCSELWRLYNCQYKYDFTYADEDFRLDMMKLFSACRSILIAHPACTSRHKDYGYDGSIVGIDIVSDKSEIISWLDKDYECMDFYLRVFDKNEKRFRTRYHGFLVSNIMLSIELNLNRLDAFMKYLKAVKRRDLGVKYPAK